MVLPITDATKSLMSERRAAKREGDEQRYAELNRSVRSAVLRDSQLDISRQIREAGRGHMYRSTRPIIAAKKTRNSVPELDPDILNQFFASVGVRTAAAVAETRRADPAAGDLPVRLPRVATCQFQVRPVTLEELHRIVMGMNGSSACGADGLSMRFVKQCFDAAGHVIL